MKHVQIRYLWTQERIAAGHIALKAVKSEDNTADILTKILSPDDHVRLTALLLDTKVVSPRGGVLTYITVSTTFPFHRYYLQHYLQVTPPTPRLLLAFC